MIDLLDSTTTYCNYWTTKYWVDLNADACETWNTNNHIKFKTTLLKSSIFHYSDAYIIVKVTIIITEAVSDVAASRLANGRDK